MTCRPRCAACCIAPSISSPIPGHAGVPGLPGGKPAGVRCPQLDLNDRCRLFGHPLRPPVCSSLAPSAAIWSTTAARSATPAFSESLTILEADFPTAQRVGERRSGGDRFIAYTYELHAESPEDIVRLLEATHLLADLKMIL